jgi:hypothetical protein
MRSQIITKKKHIFTSFAETLEAIARCSEYDERIGFLDQRTNFPLGAA